MALKSVIENKEEIPEGVKEFYEEENGKYLLKVEGLTEKAKLDEFRNSNIELQKKLEEASTNLESFNGIDAVAAKDALAKMQAVENQELMDKGQFDELLKKEKVALTGQIEALTKRATEGEKSAGRYKEELETYRVTSAIQSAVNEIGTPQQSAIADILARARTSWSIDKKGDLFCIDSSGKARYSENGTQYMSPQEWSKELVANAPHLFVSSTGSGANGSGELGGRAVGTNPWLKDNMNLTKQGEILMDNPTLAKQLAGEAGVSLDI